MHIFISAGEPSGDLHGGNLVRALQRIDAEAECVGFGGDCLEQAGCRLLYPLSKLAVMGVARVLLNAHHFLRLLLRADRYFRDQRPDAVILIDFPGFNWWVARRAHAHGIPVYYFIPPQLWAWGSWRVRKVRRWVDHVLCSLPFEEQWYRARGVDAHYFGHPYFDELPQQRLDGAFVQHEQERGGTVIGLLPGSRMQEVENNLTTLARAAIKIRAEQPEARFLMACYKPHQLDYVRRYMDAHGLSFIEPHTGRTPEIIRLARTCIAVSGSVGLELLFHGKPTVVVYRTNAVAVSFARLVLRTPYIGLVNLLAGKEVFPEFFSHRCEAQAVGGKILEWLSDPRTYQKVVNELAQLRTQVAEPGACERAACYIMDTLSERYPGKPAQAA